MGRDKGVNHFFEEVADFLGPAYLKYSFTKGTEQEVAFVVDQLGLRPGARVLDVGCGPGRHALALAARGIDVVGVDISKTFIDLATAAAQQAGVGGRARFVRGDARSLEYASEFDAVLSLCQGGFGLVGRIEDGAADLSVLQGMARAARTDGAVVASAFSAYFQVRHLEEQDSFDADSGVNHESTELRDENGHRRRADLWTSCFTPRELRFAFALCDLTVENVWSCTPGSYQATRPSIDTPEFVIVGRRQ